MKEIKIETRGAPRGNSNAAKTNGLSCSMAFRYRDSERDRWILVAEREGISLCEWMRNMLNRAAKLDRVRNGPDYDIYIEPRK